jgi:hypothetical protein
MAQRFRIGLGRNDDETFTFDVVLYKNHRQLQRSYRHCAKQDRGAEPKRTRIGAFTTEYYWSKHSQEIGSIRFSTEHLTEKFIVHESTHAALHLARYMDKYAGGFRSKRAREELVAIATDVIYIEICQHVRKRKLKIGR